MTKRRLPLDEPTRRLARLASERLSFRSGYLFGNNETHGIRTALAYARSVDLRPNGAKLSGDSPIKVDTGGLYDDYEAPAVAEVVRQMLTHYAGQGAPGPGPLAARREKIYVSLPRSMLPGFAMRAFAGRRMVEVEVVETVEKAMRREIADIRGSWQAEGDAFPDGESMEVGARVDPALVAEFTRAAETADYDPDTLLWRAVRAVVREQGRS